jgi:hypothetical protein
MKNKYRVSVEKPEGKKLFKNTGIHGRIILRWILRRYGYMIWWRVMWHNAETDNSLF